MNEQTELQYTTREYTSDTVRHMDYTSDTVRHMDITLRVGTRMHTSEYVRAAREEWYPDAPDTGERVANGAQVVIDRGYGWICNSYAFNAQFVRFTYIWADRLHEPRWALSEVYVGTQPQQILDGTKLLQRVLKRAETARCRRTEDTRRTPGNDSVRDPQCVLDAVCAMGALAYTPIQWGEKWETVDASVGRVLDGCNPQVWERLTLEQKGALCEYSRRKGDTWVQDLQRAWMRSAEPGPLQQVRNTVGSLLFRTRKAGVRKVRA